MSTEWCEGTGDPDINHVDVMWVGWAMRGEEIENIRLFTSIKKFSYQGEKRNVGVFRGCANQDIVFCLILLCFKMKMNRLRKGEVGATEKRRDQCKWPEWRPQAGGKEWLLMYHRVRAGLGCQVIRGSWETSWMNASSYSKKLRIRRGGVTGSEVWGTGESFKNGHWAEGISEEAREIN